LEGFAAHCRGAESWSVGASGQIAFGLSDVVRNALIALGADADRPFDGRAGADIGFPVRADFGQIVREDERRPGTVRTVHHDNRVRRKLGVGVELLDRQCQSKLSGSPGCVSLGS
jgi:hypothetical protein